MTHRKRRRRYSTFVKKKKRGEKKKKWGKDLLIHLFHTKKTGEK